MMRISSNLRWRRRAISLPLIGSFFLYASTITSFAPNNYFHRHWHSYNNEGVSSFLGKATTVTTKSINSSISRRMSEEDTNDSTTTAAASAARNLGLFRSTPLVRSIALSERCQRDVYLKLDALQSSGSFKDRGMAHLCLTLLQEKGVNKFISSSGGNAGLAVATIGNQLKKKNTKRNDNNKNNDNDNDIEVSVIVPQTTKELVITKLRSLGADVTVHGENWNAADQFARDLVAKANNDDNDGDGAAAAYISPYDNPLLWTGHSTIIDEVIDELPSSEEKGDANAAATIIVSVGGGGLLCGIFEGLERHNNNNNEKKKNSSSRITTVIAAETVGADSFGQTWNSEDKKNLVTLPNITSIATSLGALEVTPVVIDRAIQFQNTTNDNAAAVVSSVCTDIEAIDACIQFASDHRILVEPACGAALAVLYSERLRNQYIHNNNNNNNNNGPIVVEVCGGSGVNIELLMQWKKKFLCE